jgi:hypothetical protein
MRKHPGSCGQEVEVVVAEAVGKQPSLSLVARLLLAVT